MDDHELLMRAAMVAGMNGVVKMQYHPKSGLCGWNPLGDSGQALHLAVVIGATVHAYGRSSECGASSPGMAKISVKVSECDGDATAATRRAIVMLAANMGRDTKLYE